MLRKLPRVLSSLCSSSAQPTLDRRSPTSRHGVVVAACFVALVLVACDSPTSALDAAGEDARADGGEVFALDSGSFADAALARDAFTADADGAADARSDASVGERDAAPSPDAGAARDAEGGDAALAPDAGLEPDAALAPDAGFEPDAALAPDAGMEPDAGPNVSLGLQATSGWQIYPGGGYRYGPSLIVDGAGTIHMWSCSPGGNGAWDYVRYWASTDGGRTFGPESIAVAPTPGSRDAFSSCDPGAVRVGAWWYVGYTSTEDPRGTNNQLYLARALAPDGPFEKWDGAGWGGLPQPIVTYSGDPASYGIGEPSLVLMGTRMFVYYSRIEGGGFTDVSIAEDATTDDWPGHLVPRGHVIPRRVTEDSTDVKYVDALGRFVAVATYDRFGPNATAAVYQSLDGVTFSPAPFKGARVQPGAHNIGLAGDPSGHVALGMSTFVAYAYQPPGSAWGDWPTFLDPVVIATFPWGTTVAGGVSSTVNGGDWNWSGPKAWDGDLSTIYSSDYHATPNAEEWVMVDLGAPYSSSGLTLHPRGGGLGFPVDFVVQSSADASTWSDAPGGARAGFPNPGSAPVTITFSASVFARYFRVLATRLGPDDFGGYYLQLAEVEPQVP